jgi:hypothetical protein
MRAPALSSAQEWKLRGDRFSTWRWSNVPPTGKREGTANLGLGADDTEILPAYRWCLEWVSSSTERPPPENRYTNRKGHTS